MQLFAASDIPFKLIFVVVVVVFTLISDWLKKRAERKKAADSGTPPATHPKPQGTSSETPADWEEELRKLLQNEGTTPSSPPAPPPIIAQPPRTTPVPAHVPVRQSVHTHTEEDETLETQTQETPAPLRQAAATHARAATLDTRVGTRLEAVTSRLGTLAESAAAHQRVQKLDQGVESRLHHAAEPAAPATRFGRSSRMPQAAAEVLTLLRRPATARQVVIGAAILGPPKALES